MDTRHIEHRLMAFLVGACLALAASVGTSLFESPLFYAAQPAVAAAAPTDTPAR